MFRVSVVVSLCAGMYYNGGKSISNIAMSCTINASQRLCHIVHVLIFCLQSSNSWSYKNCFTTTNTFTLKDEHMLLALQYLQLVCCI